MNLSELKKYVKNNVPIYYGREEINVIKIYEVFNLLDVRYKNDSETFTIDLMALGELPSKEIGISIKF